MAQCFGGERREPRAILARCPIGTSGSRVADCLRTPALPRYRRRFANVWRSSIADRERMAEQRSSPLAATARPLEDTVGPSSRVPSAHGRRPRSHVVIHRSLPGRGFTLVRTISRWPTWIGAATSGGPRRVWRRVRVSASAAVNSATRFSQSDSRVRVSIGRGCGRRRRRWRRFAR